MIGDPIFITEHNWVLAKRIKPKIKKNNIILIGGGSGVQKSELAYTLQAELSSDQLQSFVISLDDYYVCHPSVRHYNRKKNGLDSVGLAEIDWQAIRGICSNFKKKKPIKFHRVHRFLNEVEKNEICSDEIDVLIVEGLYANYLKKFKMGDVSIFLEGNPKQTLAFRKIRKKENEDNSFRQKVVRKEFRVVSQLRKYANLIIPFEEK